MKNRKTIRGLMAALLAFAMLFAFMPLAFAAEDEGFILTELRAAAGETLYYTDNTAPYFCAELVSVWKIPSVNREAFAW